MEKILEKLKNKEINCEKALQLLSENGFCPNLLNDDDGRWAVKFDGFQSVVIDGPQDVETLFFVEKEFWKDNIYEALLFSMEN